MDHYFTNNENLKSEIRNIRYNYDNYNFNFLADNGVFSKDRIDYGSRLLVSTYLINKKNINNLLDAGCGYGYIGIVLSKILNVYADMIDINKRALHLAKKNVGLNEVDAKVFYSDSYENVTDKYDLIITNPPIRAGKEVILKILNQAKNYLNKNGELWFVIRKDQGAKSIIRVLEKNYTLEVVKKSKGFWIVKAVDLKTVKNC